VLGSRIICAVSCDLQMLFTRTWTRLAFAVLCAVQVVFAVLETGTPFSTWFVVRIVFTMIRIETPFTVLFDVFSSRGWLTHLGPGYTRMSIVGSLAIVAKLLPCNNSIMTVSYFRTWIIRWSRVLVLSWIVRLKISCLLMSTDADTKLYVCDIKTHVSSCIS
jgi:hypothetical protein